MPFKSEAQRRFLFAKHPDIAKRWAHDYGTPSNLPMHKKKGVSKDAVKRRMKKKHGVQKR